MLVSFLVLLLVVLWFCMFWIGRAMTSKATADLIAAQVADEARCNREAGDR